MYTITYQEKGKDKVPVQQDGHVAVFPTIGEAVFHAQLVGVTVMDLKTLSIDYCEKKENKDEQKDGEGSGTLNGEGKRGLFRK